MGRIDYDIKDDKGNLVIQAGKRLTARKAKALICLLYTSDAADERSSVDLGGRRIIKKKKYKDTDGRLRNQQ